MIKNVLDVVPTECFFLLFFIPIVLIVLIVKLALLLVRLSGAGLTCRMGGIDFVSENHSRLSGSYITVDPSLTVNTSSSQTSGFLSYSG